MTVEVFVSIRNRVTRIYPNVSPSPITMANIIQSPNYHMTLSKFIFNEELKHEKITGEFTELLSSCQTIAKAISAMLRRVGLNEPYGTPEKEKEPMKIQGIAQDIFIKILSETGSVGIIISRFSPKVIDVEKTKKGKYILVIDPLDGVTNIELGLPTGSIFGIMLRVDSRVPTVEDALNSNNKMVASGYMMYGSTTIFVLTTGEGVNEFILDPQIGEFLLTDKAIRIAEKGMSYSVNEGYLALWDDAIKEYIRERKFPDKKKHYTARYVGSMVGDFHRTLKRGGIFMYPGNKDQPFGKLELMSKCKPLAFIVTQAGGAASDGHTNILEIVPKSIHQTTPIFIGSPVDVNEVLEFVEKHQKR